MAPKVKEESVVEARPAVARKSVFREYAEALIIAVLLALVIRTFVVQAFKIPSGSMLPTLQIGDHILVNKFVYHFRPIQRGDIIVFKFPQDESRDFIKRVVGLPGETVEVRGKEVLIDGKPLKEGYAVFSDGAFGRPGERERVGPITVPPHRLFMMGTTGTTAWIADSGASWMTPRSRGRRSCLLLGAKRRHPNRLLPRECCLRARASVPDPLGADRQYGGIIRRCVADGLLA